MGAGDRSEGSAGGQRDDGGGPAKLQLGPTAAAGSAKRGRRSLDALSTETAAATLQNGGNGRRHCGMAEAAVVILQEGGTSAAALQDSGGLGVSLLLYSDRGEQVAVSVVWRAGGGIGGSGSTGLRNRRRQFCKAAALARQIGGGRSAGGQRWRGRSAVTRGVSPLPSPPSTEIPNAGIPWPLSCSHGEVTSHEYSFFISKRLRDNSFLPPLYRREKERGGAALRAVP